MNGKKITAIMLTMGMALGMTTAALPVNAEEERPEVRVLIKWAESQLSNWTDPVSYTHLDVYKRQAWCRPSKIRIWMV